MTALRHKRRQNPAYRPAPITIFPPSCISLKYMLYFIHMRYLVVILISIFIVTGPIFADTIFMKDGKEMKGLVVDEYVDRITLSTVDGERDVLRSSIDRIEYDEPELNFMQLGRAYDAKGWYDKAAFYYKKAMELNPKHKEAREAYLASHAKMWRQEERMTKKELQRQKMTMDWRKEKYKKDSPQIKDKSLLLREALGISLEEDGGAFRIAAVLAHSSADKAGIQKGDLLVGIWGRLVRYSNIEAILDELLGPKYSEVRVLMEKEISVQVEEDVEDLYSDLGISLGFEYEGLIVKDVFPDELGEAAGFRKNDFIVTIDKNFTRYLPLDSVIALIRTAKGSEDIVFTVRRKVNLRREGK